MYAKIGTNGVSLSYIYAENSKADEDTPLAILSNKDKRNAEIRDEKTVAEIKTVVKEIDPTEGDFTTLEERITYFMYSKCLCEV